MKTKITAVLATALLAPIGTAPAAAPSATLSLDFLSHELANRMVVTAVEDCMQRGFKVSAAVINRSGNLQAFLMDPLAGPHTVLTSQKKAYSAATFQTATSELTSRTDLSFAPDVLLIVGGVPIEVGGKFYGGIAVSGAEPEVDEECARAGIAAVTETLEFSE